MVFFTPVSVHCVFFRLHPNVSGLSAALFDGRSVFFLGCLFHLTSYLIPPRFQLCGRENISLIDLSLAVPSLSVLARGVVPQFRASL